MQVLDSLFAHSLTQTPCVKQGKEMGQHKGFVAAQEVLQTPRKAHLDHS